ncbi:MAG: hypothetical protein DCF19_13945 [Pseudanabaena frigida]|uniref:Uncharacterized protein n=1 Tax=Pseudanabaena frigida TaxID=945775 RepID=A0A2W4W3Y7_9CYAN|nr:MAG: hypothetical protein DCF19_13945 [Pseudanabaena frigida]
MTNSAVERSLLESLNAYVKHFEIPNAREELLAIASSILTFQQKQGKLAITYNCSEALIHQVVNQFEVELAVNCVVDSETEKLVKEVNRWRRSLESQVLKILIAYVQNFLCNQKMNLPEIILSIIPLVEDIQLHKAESESLIQRVISKFYFQINAEKAAKQVDDEMETLRKLLLEKSKSNQLPN